MRDRDHSQLFYGTSSLQLAFNRELKPRKRLEVTELIRHCRLRVTVIVHAAFALCFSDGCIAVLGV
jgi:hypothetical protein